MIHQLVNDNIVKKWDGNQIIGNQKIKEKAKLQVTKKIKKRGPDPIKEKLGLGLKLSQKTNLDAHLKHMKTSAPEEKPSIPIKFIYQIGVYVDSEPSDK